MAIVAERLHSAGALMADSPSSPEDAEEYFSASDGAQCDFSVVRGGLSDRPMHADAGDAARGRTDGDGLDRGSANRPEHSSGGASSSRGRASGPRRRRGQITPPSGGVAGARQRTAPSRFSDDRQAEREARRQKRKRKRRAFSFELLLTA